KNGEPATGAGGPGSNQCTPKKNGDMRIAHGFAQQSADKSPQFQKNSFARTEKASFRTLFLFS
ncbi:hypothetical protein, partial [Anaerotignum sp.]